ncbi:MAG: insulinase family protein [Deltaproteobacteria bacterium]|nr:insulinase family protein [Deltaproteobacteria bacterium]
MALRHKGTSVKFPKLKGAMEQRPPFVFLVVLALVLIAAIIVYFYRAGLPRAPLMPKEMKYMGETTLWGNFTVKRYTLPNGLTILIGRIPNSPVFAYQTWFKVGSRNEREGRSGLAHLFEHLMFKGTKNYAEGEMDRIMEERGSDPNASTFFDWTYYRQALPSSKENIELVARFEADRMVNLILDQKQLDSEREVVLNERRFRIDNDVQGKMYEQLYALSFEHHHYHWPIIGWAEDLKAASLADCTDFYRAYYAPNNAVITVIGDLNENEILYFIEKYYAPLASQKLPEVLIPKEPEQKKEKRNVIQFETPAEKLLLGYRIPENRHRDLASIEVLDAILFKGKSSRLYRTLVFDKGIASEIESWVGFMIDPGLYEIQINMRAPQKGMDAEKTIDAELERIQKESVTEDELEKAKNMLDAEFFRELVSNEGKARALGTFEVVAGDFAYLGEYRKRVRAVSVEDVLRVANRYLAQKNRTVISVLPKTRLTSPTFRSGM